MNKLNKITKWNETIEFYNDLIDNYKWEQKPMLSLIEELREMKLWDKYYPSTSHEALGLSFEFDNDIRFEMPMVFIIYKFKTDNFEIHYQKGEGNTHSEIKCGNKITQENINSIETWLSDNNNERKIRHTKS